MKGSWFWARPGFLWSMSVVLPLAVIPAVMVQEAMSGWTPGDTASGDPNVVRGDDADVAFGGGEIALLAGWFLGPIVYAALHLWRYRGGARFLPFIGRSWVSVALAIVSLPATGIFLLAAAAGTDLPELHAIPFALWFVLVALYCQALRAAAVHRSLPESSDTPDELTRIFE